VTADGRHSAAATLVVAVCLAGTAALPAAGGAQNVPIASRLWHAEDRALFTDLTVVTAVAATRSALYAATSGGLAVFDRQFRRWKETVGLLDGFPSGTVTAMAADPNEDAVWLAGAGQWIAWTPFGRRVDTGALPGFVDAVVLDARDPSRGAWFHTSAGWYFVARGALAAEPAHELPPPSSRIGGLTYAQLIARVPALDAVRFRIERSDQLRDYRITSAAVAPLTNEIYVGTAGNGVFSVDPVTYAVERFPAGVLGATTGAIATFRGELCAASDARVASVRRGISCFDESGGNVRYIESQGLAGLPGLTTRRLLITQRAIWAATDQGLVRSDRRGGRPVQLLMRDGLPSDDIYALWPAPTGVWVGTALGLALVADTGRGPAVAKAMRSGPVIALAGAWDTLWAGTPQGLALLPPLGDALLLVNGPGPIHEPIVALAFRGDALVAATASRFILRVDDGWRVADIPGQPIGRITAMAADTTGLWVAGTLGFAYFDPTRGLWNPLVAPGDVPLPVRDVALTRDYVWVATDAGVVRYDRRVLVP
jgi:ligand-binding sensor domain-containing protein